MKTRIKDFYLTISRTNESMNYFKDSFPYGMLLDPYKHRIGLFNRKYSYLGNTESPEANLMGELKFISTPQLDLALAKEIEDCIWTNFKKSIDGFFTVRKEYEEYNNKECLIIYFYTDETNPRYELQDLITYYNKVNYMKEWFKTPILKESKAIFNKLYKRNRTKIIELAEKYKEEESPLGDLCFDLLRDKEFREIGTIREQKKYIKILSAMYSHLSEPIHEFLELYKAKRA